MRTNRTTLALLIAVAAVAVQPADAQPRVARVVNAASQIPDSMPNYAISVSSLVRVQGIALGMTTGVSNFPVLPLLTELGGSSVTINAGGETRDAYIMSAQAAEILALIPSDMPVGPASLRVTYNGQPSAPFPIQLVPSAIGFFTQNGEGIGVSVTLDESLQPVTIFNPAVPGQLIVMLGSGAGAAVQAGPETLAALPQLRASLDKERSRRPVRRHAEHSHELVYGAGDKTTPILLSGVLFPGVNFVVIRVPDEPGCYVPFRYDGDGSTRYDSNTVTLPIGTGEVCEDPIGISTERRIARRQKAISGEILRIGEFTRDKGCNIGWTAGDSEPGSTFFGLNMYSYWRDGVPGWEDYVHMRGCSYGCQVWPYSDAFLPEDKFIRSANYLDLGNGVIMRSNAGTANLGRTQFNPNIYGASPSFNPFGGAGVFNIEGAGGNVVSAFNVPVDFMYAIPNDCPEVSVPRQTISRQQDLEIEVRKIPSSGNHHLKIELNAPNIVGRGGATIVCKFRPNQTGRYVIPAAAMRRLPASNNVFLGVLYQADQPPIVELPAVNGTPVELPYWNRYFRGRSGGRLQ